VSQSAFSLTAAGGAGSFNVIQQSDPTECGGATQDRCIWTARSQVPWITITSSMPRSGDNPAAFSVAANDSTSPRTGTIVVRDKVVTITQGGSKSRVAGVPRCQHCPGWLGCQRALRGGGRALVVRHERPSGLAEPPRHFGLSAHRARKAVVSLDDRFRAMPTGQNAYIEGVRTADHGLTRQHARSAHEDPSNEADWFAHIAAVNVGWRDHARLHGNADASRRP